MLLGFDQQFSEYVEDGSKPHTIRAPRKHPPRVGEVCHCYEGLRHKGARLLGRWVCTRVQNILIQSVHDSLTVSIDGSLLDPAETEAFFWRDGFRLTTSSSTAQAAAFWQKTFKKTSYFKGNLIHWDYDQRIGRVGD